MPLTLGCDIGSSSIKVSIFDTDTGKNLAQTVSPKDDLPIKTPEIGYAEQDPLTWWQHFKIALSSACHRAKIAPGDIKAIGISYQMHGLVMLDKEHQVIRPAIIWCDSRALEIGNRAFHDLGEDYCLSNLLNSPSNFTLSKLAWVKEHEPENFKRCEKFLLPGDFIAKKLSGTITTTESGLSEAILWNFNESRVAFKLLEYFGISKSLLPTIVPAFGEQAEVSTLAANETGLSKGTKITYRAGDQANNAFSLSVLNPGSVAATAGTSGVIYGVTDRKFIDRSQRLNTFLHVNNTAEKPRNGVLLCINGTGIAFSWLRRAFAHSFSYDDLNKMALNSRVGAEELLFFPYGNGSERTLKNASPGGAFVGLDFNQHQLPDITRSVKEGIAFAMYYALELSPIAEISSINAGKANLFQSPVFRQSLANLTDCQIRLCDTEGSQGAARGAALGAGFYKTTEETFASLVCIERVEPNNKEQAALRHAYGNWKTMLHKMLL